MSFTIRTKMSDGLESPSAGVSPGLASSSFSSKIIADKVVAGLMLVGLGPLILLLMGLVRATSRGPAIYKQSRLGRDGAPYMIYKLRTMQDNCEKHTGPQWAALKGDARVTRLGRFLRLSHLDELPQLWNVLRGEMSLVGPRPERPEFIAKLACEIPDYCDRMQVLPGITGLAQIQQPPDEVVDDVRRKVRYDLCYIRNQSLMLDMKIMIGTVMKVAGVPLGSIGQILDLPGIVERDDHAMHRELEPPLLSS